MLNNIFMIKKNWLLLVAILTVLVIIVLFVLFVRKKDSKSEKKTDTKVLSNTEVKIDSSKYIDSETGEVAVIVYNPDGKTEYKKDKAENIFNKTPSGLEFKFIKTSSTNKKPSVGDVVYLNMTYKKEGDTQNIFNTADIDENFKMRVSPPSHEGGCIEEAFMLMNEGDSAMFRIDAYDFFTKTQKKVKLPDGIKKGDKLIFNIRLVKIVSGSEFVKQNKEIYNYYLEQENSLIERYLLAFNYPVEKRINGLRILTVKGGNGKKVAKGDKVKMHFTVGYIDGGIFYSTLDNNVPFEFVTGKGEVIEGLDDAIIGMNEGDVKLIIVPFRLAYGDQRYGEIPPFSTLVFEVEIISANAK